MIPKPKQTKFFYLLTASLPGFSIGYCHCVTKQKKKKKEWTEGKKWVADTRKSDIIIPLSSLKTQEDNQQKLPGLPSSGQELELSTSIFFGGLSFWNS